jgi:integrase
MCLDLFSHTHAKNHLVLDKDPKTEKARRLLKLPDFIYQALIHHLDSQNRNQGLMFVTSNGTPYSPRNFFRDFKKQLHAAGLPDIRFHDLRHTTATLLLSQNVHPKIVQEMLGHSQISLTMDTYSHALPSLQEEAAGKIDTLLKASNAIRI